MNLRKKGNALRNKKAGKEKRIQKGIILFWGIRTKNGKKARHENKNSKKKKNQLQYSSLHS